MKIPRPWKATHNLYGMTTRGKLIELRVYAEPPAGQRRAILFSCNPAHARAIAVALMRRANEIDPPPAATDADIARARQLADQYGWEQNVELFSACRALFDAPHQEHFATRLNDEEMAALERIQAIVAATAPQREGM